MDAMGSITRAAPPQRAAHTWIPGCWAIAGPFPARAQTLHGDILDRNVDFHIVGFLRGGCSRGGVPGEP